MNIDQMILDKYFSQAATVEEKELVRQWLGTEEGQRYLAADFERACAVPDGDWLQGELPSEQMKRRFMGQLGGSSSRLKRVLKYAAVLLPFIVLLSSLWLISQRAGLWSATEYAEVRVPLGEQMTVVLQDGTIVQMNAHSYLRFPKRFSWFKREVTFTGEGYFKVAHQEKQPFIVQLKGLSVNVLGTEFNVKSYPQDSVSEIFLHQGRVRLEDSFEQHYELSPGDVAVYHLNSGLCQITQSKDDELILGWRTRKMNFYLTPLNEVLKTLERQYDVSFEVPDSSLLGTRFTLSTNRVNLKDILDELSTVSHVQFRRSAEHTYRVLSSQN